MMAGFDANPNYSNPNFSEVHLVSSPWIHARRPRLGAIFPRQTEAMSIINPLKLIEEKICWSQYCCNSASRITGQFPQFFCDRSVVNCGFSVVSF